MKKNVIPVATEEESIDKIFNIKKPVPVIPIDYYAMKTPTRAKSIVSEGAYKMLVRKKGYEFLYLCDATGKLKSNTK